MKEQKITRRTMIKLGALAGAAAASPGGLGLITGMLDVQGASAHAADVPRTIPLSKMAGFTGAQPNIVLILCDDLGQGDPGCYGDRTIRTPNIDRLASEGVRFTDFYSSASLCTPSRIGLLTGRYAIRSGLVFPLQSGGQSTTSKFMQSIGRGFGKLGAIDMSVKSLVDGIPAEEITIADTLKVAGYRTGMIGKWHLGDFSHKPEYHPLRHGFDEFFGTPMTNDELPNPLFRNDTMLETDIGLNQARLTSLSTSEAIGFIDRNKNKQPFFLYLAYHAPHLPLFASENFKDKSGAGIYGDVVEELDWGVGEVMRYLKDAGLQDDTIVIFTSDNGPWYNGNPGDAFRGRKGESFEGGFRTPLIVRWPGRIAPGSVCTEPAQNIDFFPTLSALAGLNPPADRIIDGKDIQGLLTGKEKKSPHDVLFFYHVEQLEGVRAGDWKYFRQINHYTWPQPLDKPTTTFGKLSKDKFLGNWPNLYNLKTDPGENYDLASRYPDVCEQMEKVMTGWEKGIKDNRRGWIKK
jgi:arylsulfatase A